MPIPFKTTQHFFLFEKRPTNKLKGKVTSHPFACVAVGFDPSEPKLPVRISATMCNPKDRFVRAVGAVKALGLLQAGTHDRAQWFGPTAKNIKTVLFDLGFINGIAARFKSTSNKVEWTRASKTFKNVLADVQGIRFKEPLKKVAKAKPMPVVDLEREQRLAVARKQISKDLTKRLAGV
jgi:hypothetical protein